MKSKRVIVISFIVLLLSAGAVWAESGYKNIEVFFERIQVVVNGTSSELTKDSILYNGSVYVPLRSLGEMLGAQIAWDAKERSVHMDFLTDQTNQLLQASKKSIYQYIAMQNNRIMNDLKSGLSDNDTEKLKQAVLEYEELKQVAKGIGDKQLEETLGKLQAATELLRGGWASKNMDDYLLAWEIYRSNAQALLNRLQTLLAN